jgi:hypothetical protein
MLKEGDGNLAKSRKDGKSNSRSLVKRYEAIVRREQGFPSTYRREKGRGYD